MGVNELRELGEDFYYLIGTLTAGSDDHDIGLGLLRDSVLEHGFTGTEGTRDEACTTLYDGVNGIDNTYTSLEELEGTGFVHIVGHGHLYGPTLNHVHVNVVALLIGEHGDSVLNGILAFTHDRLHGAHTLLLEGHHDFQGLAVLLYRAEPVRSLHLVAYLGEGLELPFAVVVESVGILSTLEEHTIHLVEVVLQTVIVL